MVADVGTDQGQRKHFLASAPDLAAKSHPFDHALVSDVLSQPTGSLHCGNPADLESVLCAVRDKAAHDQAPNYRWLTRRHSMFNMLRRTLLGSLAWVLASTAMAAATVQDGIEAMRRGDFAAAYPIWTELANAGDDKAAIEAGFMHHFGRGRPVSFPDAYSWYLKAFPRNGDAWNNIGVMFRDALGVPQNRRIAYLMFLTVHMAGIGNESTVMRANRNLRREIAELPPAEKQEALCYTLDYVRAFVESRGTLTAVPPELRASPQRKRIRELPWWLPGEVTPYECADGT